MNEGEGNRSRSLRGALGALNFSMADMQAGIGPFPGVLLRGRGWATGAIGTVMTVGGTSQLPVRILDGIGAGLQSVAVQGVGASLSPAKVMTPACAGRPDARPQPKIA